MINSVLLVGKGVPDAIAFRERKNAMMKMMMMMKMTMMFPEGKKGDVQHPPVGYEDAGGSRQRRRKRRKRRPQQRVSRRKSHRVVGFAPKHLLAREHSRRHHPKASSSLVSVSRE
jgi:hypothetical protein